MSLQNRVDPFGDIHANPARGIFLGNRGGKIHDPATRTLLKRRFASRRWIICVTAFKGRKRTLMGEGYTELFFLDEVTALAAGTGPAPNAGGRISSAFAWPLRRNLAVQLGRTRLMRNCMASGLAKSRALTRLFADNFRTARWSWSGRRRMPSVAHWLCPGRLAAMARRWIGTRFRAEIPCL